ncbi:MAG: NAD(P)-dependent alcohol dehydrogenase [Nocardioides sp.]
MRAAVYEVYGGPEVVAVRDVPTPVPGAGQVLVRVRASTVNSGDARMRAARFPAGFALMARLFFGVRRPRRKILGVVFAGEIAALGSGVEGARAGGEAGGRAGGQAGGEAWAVGDRVAGMTGAKVGCHAEFVVADCKKLSRVPEGVGIEEAAAALFGGTTALTFVRDKVRVQAGERVLVNGAAGSVGVAAVQLADRAGGHVTGVCSAGNGERVRALGAAAVIDYARTPLERHTERYDVVIDTVGNLGIAGGKRLLAPGGRLALVAAGLGDTIRARGAVSAGTAVESAANFDDVLAMVERGELNPVISERLPLERIAEAHALVDTGHKVGNVVITP